MADFQSRTIDDFDAPVSEWKDSRFAVFFSEMIAAGETKTIDLGGEPEPFNEHPFVADVTERELVPFLASAISTRQLLTDALGMPSGQTWFWIGEERRTLLPGATLGKPGDFDIICGVLRDGRPSLEFLCGIEVKRRRVREDGSVKGFPSGTGETQAVGLVELGFDRSLLVHCLVSERRSYHPYAAPTWQGMMNAENSSAAAASTTLMHGKASGAGFMVLMIGQAERRDYRKSHTAIGHLATAPPTMPRRESAIVMGNRTVLRARVGVRLGASRTGRFFRSFSRGRIETLPEPGTPGTAG
jgi:hypothetical protein